MCFALSLLVLVFCGTGYAEGLHFEKSGRPVAEEGPVEPNSWLQKWVDVKKQKGSSPLFWCKSGAELNHSLVKLEGSLEGAKPTLRWVKYYRTEKDGRLQFSDWPEGTMEWEDGNFGKTELVTYKHHHSAFRNEIIPTGENTFILTNFILHSLQVIPWESVHLTDRTAVSCRYFQMTEAELRSDRTGIAKRYIRNLGSDSFHDIDAPLFKQAELQKKLNGDFRKKQGSSNQAPEQPKKKSDLDRERLKNLGYIQMDSRWPNIFSSGRSLFYMAGDGSAQKLFLGQQNLIYYSKVGFFNQRVHDEVTAFYKAYRHQSLR